MDRRRFQISILCCAALASAAARAAGLQDLTGNEIDRGLKGALEHGAVAAVALLGRPGGFLDNPAVRIPLPGFLADAAKLLKVMGRGKDVAELEVAMNRAAEAAVPFAKDLLLNAVRTMTIADASNILSGGQTSVTDFFAGRTRAPLAARFLPVVTAATRKVKLAEKYNAVAGQAKRIGVLKDEDATVEDYVTGKSLDGLYFVIGGEEKKIRANPAASADALVRKVFGSLR